MKIKQKKHAYKNWVEAITRDCSPECSPHDPRVIYHPDHGFAVKSKLSPLGDGWTVVLNNYEPYGTSESEYTYAVKQWESRENEIKQLKQIY